MLHGINPQADMADMIGHATKKLQLELEILELAKTARYAEIEAHHAEADCWRARRAQFDQIDRIVKWLRSNDDDLRDLGPSALADRIARVFGRGST